MSGHLMATVNPKAGGAEEYDVPPIGARVQFFARPGYGRSGQNTFAADVMHADPKTGNCVLWVLYGRDDYQEFVNIRQRSDQEPHHCWDYLPDGYEALAEELDETKAQLETLTKAVFGDWSRPTKPDGTPKSIIDILAEFEKRVFAAQASPAPATSRRARAGK